jgi:hypothetical protein
MKVGEHEQALRLVLNAIDIQQGVGKFLHMPALFRMKGRILASRSAEDYLEAEGSLLSAIDWAKRQSATLFEIEGCDGARRAVSKAGAHARSHKHLSAALDRIASGIVYPDHTRALQILNRLQSDTEAVS